jgi:TPR repeat protein
MLDPTRGGRFFVARLKLGALLGDAFACHQLGAIYATGDHFGKAHPKDEPAALRWYRRGARRGDPECLYDLAFMILLGEGTVPDPGQAIDLLEQAAERGYGEAIRLLADLHEQGAHGVSANPAETERWRMRLEEHLARHPEERRDHER